MLTVYVDDLLLAGPKGNHKKFWETLSKHVDIEEVTSLERFLGRLHKTTRTGTGGTISYDMSDYASQSVEMYKKLTGVEKLREASTPFCPEGSLVACDDEVKGEVAPHACAIIMKQLWLARLARPDLVKAINLLACKVQNWTRNDDKRLYRLTCYLNSTKDLKLNARVGDPPSDLCLRLYVDADFAGDIEDAKSTSGMFLILHGPNTFFPIAWNSTKQTATSRSTTESEVVSLANGLFSEALPMLNFWDLALGRPCHLEIKEDNQATILVVKKGYSKKLRHLSRTHRVNLSSLKEQVSSPHVSLDYVVTKEQAADIFTKALPPQNWGPALAMLGLA